MFSPLPATTCRSRPGAAVCPSPARPNHYRSSLADYTGPRYPAAPICFGRRWAAVSVRYQQPVYGSVESAKAGVIEQAEILSTAGRARDAEVLRVVQRLLAAGSPALLQGRPVRVHFVLPITFKIQ